MHSKMCITMKQGENNLSHSKETEKRAEKLDVRLAAPLQKHARL